MDEEKVDEIGGKMEEEQKQQGVSTTMKFSFAASKPKFSASRPPKFPKGKHRSDEGFEEQQQHRNNVDFVTAFDEHGVVGKDPKGLRGARVIPKLEDSWRPEKRMKNIVMETDVMTMRSEDRFEREETVLGGPSPGVQYGLTVGVKKSETSSVQQVVTTAVTELNGSATVKTEKTTWERTDQKTANPPLTFAQLEDERLRQDLTTLPDEADMDAYDEMPVEDYGEALLRGMGWEKGKPIGRNCKVAVVPVEYVRRPARTGLGAEPALKEVNNTRQIKPGESRVPAPELVASVGPDGRVRNVVSVDEKLVERSRRGVVKGKVMSIISGRHLGLRGEVLDSEKSDRVSMKLVKSGEKVLVSATDLADIGSVEEEKVLKQIRQLKIGNGEASQQDDREDVVDLHTEEDSKYGRERRDSRREKDARRDERDDYTSRTEYRREEEERRSRSRKGDSRRDEQGERSIGREGRRERKREEYQRTNDDMEVEDEDRIRRSDDRRGSSRDQKKEDRRDEGRRGESRWDGRREDEKAQRDQVRAYKDRDERGGAERERRGNFSDSRVSEDNYEKRGGSHGANAARDGIAAGIEVRYKDAWLTSQIRVRIISKTLKGGKFYLKKGRILDVVTPKECDILLDESGEVLQRVQQDQLETALPKRGGRIMVVSGKHRGHLGKLIERDSEKEVGFVQMEESFEMMTLSLDLLAEFVGDAGERDD